MLAALLLAAQADHAGAARPARIISLNLCTDQLLSVLASRDRIASLTWLARDCDISPVCEAAKGLPVNYGSSEELVATQPDLVLAGKYTARPATFLARGLGIPVEEVEPPATLQAVRAQIIRMAAVLGEPSRGDAMVADLDRRFAAVSDAVPGGPRPVAVLYQANGVTVGAGSLIDDILRRAGFDNLAARLDIDNYGTLPLETLIAAQPDRLILNDQLRRYPSLASALLQHPVLTADYGPERRILLPQRWWSCAGPWVADAAERLAAARLAWAASRAAATEPPP